MLISSSYMLHIWLIMGFHSHGGTPIAGWLGKIHENPIRMDDLGYPHLWKHPYGLHYWILMYTVRIYYGVSTFFMFQFVCLSMYLFICMWMCVCVSVYPMHMQNWYGISYDHNIFQDQSCQQVKTQNLLVPSSRYPRMYKWVQAT